MPANILRKPFEKIKDILFPKACLGCGKRNSYICQACLSHLKKSPKTPFPYAYPLYDYRDSVVRHLLWELKYQGITEIAKCFVPPLEAHIQNKLSGRIPREIPLYIIGIPSRKSIKRKRGYTQSELIAHALSKQSPSFVHIPDALLNTAPTQQTTVPKRSERIRNIEGTFVLNKGINLHEKDVITIDDITTTGATIREARRVLLDAGAQSVHAFVIAH